MIEGHRLERHPIMLFLGSTGGIRLSLLTGGRVRVLGHTEPLQRESLDAPERTNLNKNNDIANQCVCGCVCMTV